MWMSDQSESHQDPIIWHSLLIGCKLPRWQGRGGVVPEGLGDSASEAVKYTEPWGLAWEEPRPTHGLRVVAKEGVLGDPCATSVCKMSEDIITRDPAKPVGHAVNGQSTRAGVDPCCSTLFST